MKQFRFRLEPLLEIRKRDEQEKEIELARINGQCFALTREIDDRRTEARQNALHRFESGTTRDSMLTLELFIKRLQIEADTKEAELHRREKERDKAREIYTEAAKKRKALDKLKEKRKNQYLDKIIREEQKELDEMNSAKAARKAGQTGGDSNG